MNFSLDGSLFEFMEEQAELYNTPAFIEFDPISIPHQFSKKEDIEIAGFITATIAWGQRPTILKNANRLMAFMDGAPFDFVMHHQANDLLRLEGFVHRTFNDTDCKYFIKALKNIYQNHGGIEAIFQGAVLKLDLNTEKGIVAFRKVFFELPFPPRTQKHLSDPGTNSAVKRLNMFLRWMVRKDKKGVDFGLWTAIHPRQLLCPLDIHSGRMARHLGLLDRNQNDWKAVVELTNTLKCMDPEDPVKYDFALFGLGVNQK
jgi:uncharacterized protein (TIGR02757 family)